MAPKEGDSVLRHIILLVTISFLLHPTFCMIQYGRDELLHVLNTRSCTFDLSIPLHEDILLSNDHWSSRHYDRPPRKRGKRAGALVKFRRRTTRPPLPAIVLSNVQSINNKTDEFQFVMTHKREFSEASAVCLTETWLVPDTPIAPSPLPALLHSGQTGARKSQGKLQAAVSAC